MPKVVVCTPTKNRRWAYPFSRACLNAQLETDWIWIIVDNSDDPDQDWSAATEDPRVIYKKVEGDLPVGAMRNHCIDEALKHPFDYLVFWDDDDYYPPTRISAGLAALESNPAADLSGCSRLWILLVRENVMLTSGPFHDKHGTAATWTVRRSYVEKHRFDPAKKRGEEVSFTQDWKADLVQVPNPEDVMVVMGHAKNTVDKSDLFKNPIKYRAVIHETANGKMYFRSKWPVPWDLWKQTFLC
jgi:glycosyltransferase involved in cell wall biosynthesis